MYPTPKDPVQEAIAAVKLLENRKQKIKLEDFLPHSQAEIEEDQAAEHQVAMFTAEGHLDPSAAFTPDLAQICNFDSGKHVPSMHFQARVRAAASSVRGNAKKHSGWHSVYCLKDSGATLVVINSRLVKEKQLPITASSKPLKVKLADSSTRTLTDTVQVEIQFDLNYKYTTTAFVMDLGPACDILLGTPWLSSLGPHLADWDKGTLAFKHRDRIITLKSKRKNPKATMTVNGIELISAKEARHECRAWEKRRHKQDELRPGFVLLQPLDSPSAGTNGGSEESNGSGEPAEKSVKETDSASLESASASLVSPYDRDPQYPLAGTSSGSEESQGSGEPAEKSVKETDSASLESASASMVSPYDRDLQYPFGDTKEYPIAPNRCKPTVLRPTDPRGPQLATLLGTYQALSLRASPSAPETVNLTKCRREIFEVLKSINSDGSTLGDKFWTEARLEILSDIFKTLYADEVFSEDIPGTHQGSDRLPQAQIRFKDDWDGKAPFARPIRLSDAHMEIMRSQLGELLEKGIIEPSASPFGAAAFVVPKPHTNGTKWRMVVSYKALNELTVSDRWPLPDIPTILGRLTGKAIMSTWDLTSAFYMNKVLPSHVERTAMTTPFGSFAWLYLPMGLSVAPAIQQRNINLCIHGPIKEEYLPEAQDPWRTAHPCYPDMSLPTEQSTAVFIDDGLTFSDSVEEHAVQHLPVTLERLRIYGMKVKPSKANLFTKNTDFLGYKIRTDGLAPQSTKVDAVVKFPLPKNLSQLRGFLGLVGYYRIFIYNFSAKAKALNDLTKQGVPFPKPGEWTNEQLESFAILKLALVNAPVLVHFDWAAAMDGSRRVRVQSDASLFAMGAVLMQEAMDKDGQLKFHPVAFASKSFIPAEVNYSATERELRGLVWATTEVFRHYLVGLPSYTLQGDHQPLKALLSAKEYSRRQYRWLERLAEYNVPAMEYVPGTQLVVPDALSRRADLEELLQPVRDSMSAQQRAEWGLINPEATFGNAKAGPLPDVVTTPLADHPLVIRPASLATIPPIDERTIKDISDCQSENTSMGELQQSVQFATPQRSEQIVTSMNSQTANVLNHIVGTGFAFMLSHTSDPSILTSKGQTAEGTAKGTTMAGERRSTTTEPYATSHHLLQQLQFRIGKFNLDASPFASNFRGLKWLKHANRMRKLWEGKRVLVDCTKGERFPGQTRDLLDTFLAAKQEDGSSSALFILPYSTNATESWEAGICASPAFTRLHCFRTGNTSDFLGLSKSGRSLQGPYTTKCPTQLWWAEATTPSPAAMAVTTRNSRKARESEDRGSQPSASTKREPEVVLSIKTFLQRVRKAYATDARLSQVLYMDALQAAVQETSTHSTFKVSNQEFTVFGDLIWKALSDRVLLVLPEDREVINFAMLHSHDSPTAGHLGFRKTLDKAQRRFYWPRMQQDIKDYVRSCHI